MNVLMKGATAAAISVVSLALLTPTAHAQSAAGGQPAAAAGAAEDTADGEVRKIDLEAGKVTLKHGEIRSLGMPGMTMVFTVKDRAVLQKFKAGDKVRFKATSEGSTFFVTDIKPAP